MTQQQIKWASQHDWFVAADGGTVHTMERTYNYRTDTLSETPRTFTNFAELRRWAGY